MIGYGKLHQNNELLACIVMESAIKVSDDQLAVKKTVLTTNQIL